MASLTQMKNTGARSIEPAIAAYAEEARPREEPRLVFLHYWGIGPAASLAAGADLRWRSRLRPPDPDPARLHY
jgi:hypothetical protein